jgi:L-amino acid N-acyltransferase YncA
MQARKAARTDAAAIAAIYNQGIEDRIATFETRPRAPEEIESWFDGVHPIVVVQENGRIVGFAATFGYRTRNCYAGIAETSLYVARDSRRRGAGRLAMTALIGAAEAAGFWKLVSRVFPENSGSLRLIESLGFREVGIYQKHGRLDGVWRDVVIVERLIPSNLK